MELELSEDQEFFLETTRKFLAAESPLAVVRDLESEPAGFDAEHWRRGAELGWTSMLVPEADGGGSLSEHGLLDLVLVAEAMGALVSPGPLGPVNVVASAVARSGTADQKAALLPGLLSGDAVAAWCGPEPVRARDDGGDGLVLTGTVPVVEAGAEAAHLLVTASTGEGLTQLVVPADADGLTVTPLGGLDLVRRFAAVTFEGVEVPVEAAVGVVGGAASDVERQLQIACVLQCAETCGALDRVFEMTLEYLGERYSFGRPLSSYQALKHRIADDKMWLEACHATATSAARAVASESAEAAEAVSVAKHWIGPHATELVQDCIQLHGGIGVTWEHDLHLYLRRVTVNRLTHGTPDWHAERLATRILGGGLLTGTVEPGEQVEPVEEFRLRARTWLADNMPPESDGMARRGEPGRWEHERGLQRRLWDGGFAGICFPAEHGGLGLSPEHQRAFTVESLGYDMPYALNVPTLGILAATLVDHGTEAQKARHLPAILRGEEVWVQFLSEPCGGSDLAGCLTRADRDGDVFIMNGSKIWSSGAVDADYAMCLARTSWDVPKHRGLTMFIMAIHQPGVHVEQIRQVDGSMEFCQEFFDDVPIPAADVVGDVDDGWTVASRLLVHERLAVGGGSPYTSGRSGSHDSADEANDLVDAVIASGRAEDPRTRQLVAEAHARRVVHRQLNTRVTQGMRIGAMPPPAGSLMKLFAATNVMRRAEIGLELAGEGAVAWTTEQETASRRLGQATLVRQGMSLGGGSNEIQRNIISERLLGLPREHAADREVPYREVRRGRPDVTEADQVDAFRHELRAWLDAHVTPAVRDLPRRRDDDAFEAHRAWNATLFDAGYGAIVWPAELGGRDAGLAEQLVYNEEMARARAPGPVNAIGVANIAPAIMAYGTEAQKARFLRSMLRGDEIWSQGMSEPEAGSDLASLRCAAVVDGDHFVVNGQKTWNSNGDRADWCQLYVRTDPEVPKHKGITCLLVDMRTPGIETRPIRTMAGDAGFSEIFLTDVRVPRAALLGEIDDGWNVATRTLSNERAGVAGLYLAQRAKLDRLLQAARAPRDDGSRATDAPVVRDALVARYIDVRTLELLAKRSLGAALSGRSPGPEGSVIKLAWSRSDQALSDTAVDVLGMHALGDGWGSALLSSRSLSIAGGTTEVNKNIIGERVLGLPREPA